jgi:hypothetical protein
MSRAIRRHHLERVKSRAKRHMATWHAFRPATQPVQEPSVRRIGQHAATPHPCSCYACGNQRQIYGNTRQERINRLSYLEQVQ